MFAGFEKKIEKHMLEKLVTALGKDGHVTIPGVGEMHTTDSSVTFSPYRDFVEKVQVAKIQHPQIKSDDDDGDEDDIPF